MPRQLTIRASRHRLQEEPPLHLSVATHNFVERGDSEVEVVVGEVWSRCGRGAVEQQTEVCNFRCSALRDLFMQRLRDGALSLPARGLRQGRHRRPPACPLPAPHVAPSLRNGDDLRLTPRFLPCTEDLRIILRGRIMTPLPPGMLVELVKHVKKEQGWASTLSSLLTTYVLTSGVLACVGEVCKLWGGLRAAFALAEVHGRAGSGRSPSRRCSRFWRASSEL